MKKSCGNKSKIDKVCRGIACSASILDSDLIIAIKSKDSVILTSRVRVYVNKDGWSQIGLINNLELQANVKSRSLNFMLPFLKILGYQHWQKRLFEPTPNLWKKLAPGY